MFTERATHRRCGSVAARVAVAISLWTLTSACILVRAARNNESLATIATMKGSLNVDLHPGTPAFVAILRGGAEGWRVHSARVMYESGPFEFYGPAGQYRLFAFSDLDGDRTWNVGEPSACSRSRALASGEQVEEAALVPSEGGPPAPTRVSLELPTTSEELWRVHRGDLASLDEERFSDAAGAFGYWQPADFALRYGMGVSFLEPYDPQKVPVLFVHGASGSPVNFKAVIAAMDRSRFQPWVLSYPSGVRLGFASAKLLHVMDDLHQKLGFERLLVVGHSMGGLVARAFVGKVAARREHSYVRLLVTIATPFDGHEAAKSGVKSSPVVLPSWRDMVSDSPFLRSLRTPLPAGTPHHLFFGYMGGASSGGPTDGTVTLRSMLFAENQANASHVVGFAETHDSILRSRKPIAELNTSLRAGAESLQLVAALQR